jgi:predicted nucleotidyltransferase
MRQSLSSILFPEYRRRVLTLLFLRPDEQLHGREVARRTGLPAGTITRELTKLAQAGLLKREKRGNQQLYGADKSSPIFTELASILRKTSGIVDVLAGVLAPLSPLIRAAFVFGSVARGAETSGSDVDLMVIGEMTFREAIDVLHPVQATLGREVNVQLLTPDEFKAKAQKDAFMKDVLGKPKLFVIGNENDLAELAGHHAR